MSAKHTPGPWEADGYHIRQSVTASRSIAEVAYTGPHHTPPHEYPKSCRLIDEANARLIAASPDLLEACQQWILERDNPAPCWVMKKQAEDKMRTAIAKALGQEA